MNANWQQIWPLVAIVGGVLGLAFFVKKAGWIGIIILIVLGAVWMLRSNPEWFEGLDGTLERAVEVRRAD